MLPSPRYLTFALLDEIEQGSANREDLQKDIGVKRIGPLIEVAYQHYEMAENQLLSFPRSEVVTSLSIALQSTGISSYPMRSSLAPQGVEFIRNFQTEEEAEDTRWISFVKRLENAARCAGLTASFAKALAGTLDEMAFNVLEHSESPHTAIVGYRYSAYEFEYVISDAGVGVLNSLKSHPDYADLSDSDAALRTALREGESRYGHNAGRGSGFRDLMNNIASLNSCLRFRSGSHAFVIDGWHQPTVSYSVECVDAPGFLISVLSKKSRNQG
jgi:hypothetical protein